MPKQHLSDRFIKTLHSQGGRVEYYDQHLIDPQTHTLKRKGVKGLLVRLTQAGNKYFYYNYWHDGKAKKFKIGSYPNISLSDARDRARELAAQINEGIDPQAQKQKAKAPKQVFTFSKLCDRFKARHLPTLRKRTRDEYQRIIGKELTPKLGTCPAGEVSRKQIVDLLDAIAIDRDAPTLSNRVRATLSSIFSFGIDKAIVEANPVLNVRRKKKETKRDRTYSPDEIKALWSAFEQQDEPVQSIYKILMICGQRSGETRRMK